MPGPVFIIIILFFGGVFKHILDWTSFQAYIRSDRNERRERGEDTQQRTCRLDVNLCQLWEAPSL